MSTLETLKQKFSSAITGSSVNRGHDEVFVEKSQIFPVMTFLKNEGGFNMLLDLCGVDYKGQEPRFEVVYHLYNLSTKGRLRVRVKLAESDLKIPSVISLWICADWFEREAFDMYGIHFEGHPNLKRLLMWEGFQGHPLRKDYPLNKRQPIPEPLDIV